MLIHSPNHAHLVSVFHLYSSGRGGIAGLGEVEKYGTVPHSSLALALVIPGVGFFGREPFLRYVRIVLALRIALFFGLEAPAKLPPDPSKPSYLLASVARRVF